MEYFRSVLLDKGFPCSTSAQLFLFVCFFTVDQNNKRILGEILKTVNAT
jgi:hypothetical protein